MGKSAITLPDLGTTQEWQARLSMQDWICHSDIREIDAAIRRAEIADWKFIEKEAVIERQTLK